MQNMYLDKCVNFPLVVPSLKKLICPQQCPNYSFVFSDGFWGYLIETINLIQRNEL